MKVKLSLSDPMEKYLPEFKDLKVAIDPHLGAEGGTREPKTKVTIAEILSHTGGYFSS